MNSTDSYRKSITDVFLPVLRQLFQIEESVPFKTISGSDCHVVDLSVPPTDLSDVESRLTLNMYEEPWKFISDVWTLFGNAWLYNKKSSKIYQYCSKVAEIFEHEANKVMRSLGYCCGRWYTFDPPTLKCSGKELCSIPKNEKYYSYNKEFNFCYECFKLAETFVFIKKNEKVSKERFVEMKNYSFELEPFIECSQCRKNMHEICVLYVKSLEKGKFTCDICEQCAGNRRKKLYEEYSAKRLLVTKLSEHIQDRVDTFLKCRNLPVGCITIRVIASSKKCTQIKNAFKRRFTRNKKFPDEFPYTAKTVFVFYEIDAVDVAIFAFHVQEYDDACPEPNNRRVYISYLDSVNFFQPREHRTDLYFEILLGYMDYIKKLGYKAVHVWACPPPDGDDYLFYRHPESQKPTSHDRLEDWYNRLLRRGILEGIILNNPNSLDHSNVSTISYASSVDEIPYFENDFWPNMLEDCVQELERNSQISEDLDVLNEHLINKYRCIREESKEVFFVFQLHSYDAVPHLSPINDPDLLVKCHFMDDRETFLIMCQEKNYEFSTIRRAKFTSLVLLYELHSHEYEKSATYSCNICMKNIVGGYHCKICDDFDLCARCLRESGHEHDMEYLITDQPNSVTSTVNETETPARCQVIYNNQTYLEYFSEAILKIEFFEALKFNNLKAGKPPNTEKLSHARLCKDDHCGYNECARIKRLFSHFTTCPAKMKNTCTLCKDLLTMCWHHAKYCVKKNCTVPICERIKVKLAKK